jgi:DNA-directed RNA polymerase subunit RPC12/RpoP
MTDYRCARCGRDLRLVAHKISDDGKRWCPACSPGDAAFLGFGER